MLYEIGDPGAYVLPDVACDFRNVRVAQVGADRVAVAGARGLPPTESYKVSATWMDGFRCNGMLVIIGIDAAAKARRTGAAIIERTRALLARAGLPDFSATHVEVIGAESIYGPHSRAGNTREVMLRVVVDHASRQALDLFAREIAPAGTSWSPGTTGPALGRPSPSALIKQFAFTLPKCEVAIRVRLDGESTAVTVAVDGGFRPETPAPAPENIALTPDADALYLPLVRLAYARSGDKGNLANIGVIAREPEFLPIILEQLTPARVKAYFAHLVAGDVVRYRVPGLHACNFVLHDALDGGGTASMRLDPLGKGMAQMLLDMPVAVPPELARRLGGVLGTGHV